MALTIYPTTDYDTFCLLADAETLIAANVPSAQHTTWDALADSEKEILLRQSSLIIKNKITPPSTLEDDLQLACALLANDSVGATMSDDDGKTGNIKVKDISGVIRTEYFSPSKTNNDLPDMVVMLLAQYEISSTSSFTFERA